MGAAGPDGGVYRVRLKCGRCEHFARAAFVLSYVDRVTAQGTLPVFCYADGMTAYLSKRRILRRLRTPGLIKKASHCYQYYLTACR